MISTITKSIISSAILLIYASGQSAYASIQFFPDLIFSSDQIAGECIFGVYNEAYITIDADCKTLTTASGGGSQVLVKKQITNYSLDQSPHTSYTYYNWDTLWEGTPASVQLYCQLFGSQLPGEPPKVILGTANGGESVSGVFKCRRSPQLLKVYTAIECDGPFTIVISVGSVIPGIHLSYTFTSGGACFPVVIDPRP